MTRADPPLPMGAERPQRRVPRRVAFRFFATVGVLAVAAIGVGGTYATFVVRRGFSARDEPSSLEKGVARTVRRWSIPNAARDMTNPVPATREALDSARAHWADHCATCHGNDGSGVSEMGRMYPPAPDMRKAPTQELTDGELFYIIENGIRLTGMPAWGEPGSDGAESWKLVSFIRHLPQISLEELEEIKRLKPKSAEDREEEEYLRQGGANQGHKEPSP